LKIENTRKMLKYDLKYSVAEVAKILEVDNELIKTWCYHFSSYLSSGAVPTKGVARKFELEDLRVFGYILIFWEDDPDVESIKMGLNSNDHQDNLLIGRFLSLNTPFLTEPSQNIGENWKNGILVSGFSEFGDNFYLAKSYKLAGDRLIEAALANNESAELYAPAIFNYRQSVELYMKAILGKYEKSHDLSSLLKKLKVYLKNEFNILPPTWFEDTVLTFNELDPSGTIMRYGGHCSMEEMFIDFDHLKSLMSLMSKIFQDFRLHQGFTNGI
jgi:HEPN domain-containing protein